MFKKKKRKDKSQKKQIVVILYDRLTYVSALIAEEKMWFNINLHSVQWEVPPKTQAWEQAGWSS